MSYLSIGLVILDGEVRRRRRGRKAGSGRVVALLAPVVRVDAALQSDKGHLHGWKSLSWPLAVPSRGCLVGVKEGWGLEKGGRGGEEGGLGVVQ